MQRRRSDAQIRERSSSPIAPRPGAGRLRRWFLCGFLCALVFGKVFLTWLERGPSSGGKSDVLELERLVDEQNATIVRLRKAIAAQIDEEASFPFQKKPKSVAVESSRLTRPNEYLSCPPTRPTDVVESKGHKILSLSEKELMETPMDELMATYGRTAGGSSCDDDFGTGLIDRWRAKGRDFCSAKTNASSSIECFLIKQRSHAGKGDNLCLLKGGVGVNFRDLADGKTPALYFERYVASKHQQQHSKIKYSKGTLASDCEPDKKLWKAEYFPGWNVNWFHSFEQKRPTCDITIKEPSLIVERDTFANFFHNSEDFFNTFIALAILRWPLKNLRIFLTDLYPKGPFWPMWSEVFNDNVHEPLDAFSIAEKFKDKTVCFERAAIAILGAAAPITVASFNTKCSKSPMVRAYADLVIAKLHLANETRYFKKRDPKRVVVTFMARRSASDWPEKRFCDSKNSFFKCERLQHLGKRSLGRSVKNDAAVVKALESLQRKSFANGAKVTVQDVDYSNLDFRAQIKTNLDTDVMVGPHGAGLLHNIFMPDRAALVELFIDSSSANRHFHNFAKWQGRNYYSRSLPNPIPTNDLINILSQAIANLDLSNHY